MASSDVTSIDGGVMEGGGQILRVAIGISALLRKPIRVFNIRANRKVPGLRAQHLSGLELIRDICHGNLTDAVVGSTEIELKPNVIKCGNYTADAKTAGSVGLLFQVSLPCLLFADGPSSTLLKGGTNAEFAPQIDYLTHVFKNQSRRFGIDFKCNIIKRGYYPKGGGSIDVQINNIQSITPVELLNRGKLTKICGRSYVAGVLPLKVAHQMADSARLDLRKKYPDIKIEIKVSKEDPSDAVGTGSGIFLVAETDSGCEFAGSAIGRKGVQAEKVGKEAADILIRNLSHGGCVDEFLQDQLIIFMALADGKSRIKIGPVTLHTQTAIHVVELLTQAKFTMVKTENGDERILECNGIGYQMNG